MDTQLEHVSRRIKVEPSVESTSNSAIRARLVRIKPALAKNTSSSGRRKNPTVQIDIILLLINTVMISQMFVLQF